MPRATWMQQNFNSGEWSPSVFDYKARREVPSLCVNNLEIREGDHRVVEHVWVTWAELVRIAKGEAA